jgi:hypothetical protein
VGSRADRPRGDLARGGDFGTASEEVNRRILELRPEDTASMTRLAKCLVTRAELVEAQPLYVGHWRSTRRTASLRMRWRRFAVRPLKGRYGLGWRACSCCAGATR